MANIIKIKIQRESNVSIKDGALYEEGYTTGFQVYACCDELMCWIGSCTDIKSLEEVVGPEELLSSFEESLSEYEMECLLPVLKHNNYNYMLFDEMRTAIKGVR